MSLNNQKVEDKHFQQTKLNDFLDNQKTFFHGNQWVKLPQPIKTKKCKILN